LARFDGESTDRRSQNRFCQQIGSRGPSRWPTGSIFTGPLREERWSCRGAGCPLFHSGAAETQDLLGNAEKAVERSQKTENYRWLTERRLNSRVPPTAMPEAVGSRQRPPRSRPNSYSPMITATRSHVYGRRTTDCNRGLCTSSKLRLFFQPGTRYTRKSFLR